MNNISTIFTGSFLKRGLAIFFMIMLSACTTAGVDDSLSSSAQTAQIPAQAATLNPANTVAGATANGQTQVAAAGAQASADANAQATNALNATQPAIPAGTVAQNQLQQATTPQTPATVPTQQVASLDTSKSITFLPFEGAPAVKSNSITRFLNSTALSNGLSVLPATRTGAKYKVKGYFSALTDGSGTLLVYVWDVTDETGKRLHRINGRERSGSTSTDPWQAISDEEIERVADSTTARLKTWVERR